MFHTMKDLGYVFNLKKHIKGLERSNRKLRRKLAGQTSSISHMDACIKSRVENLTHGLDRDVVAMQDELDTLRRYRLTVECTARYFFGYKFHITKVTK